MSLECDEQGQDGQNQGCECESSCNAASHLYSDVATDVPRLLHRPGSSATGRYNTPMQAFIVKEHGGVERLERIDLPEPQPGPHAVVQLRATSLNHLDVWVRRGVPGHRFPLPLVPCSEGSGTIVSIPEGDHGLGPGDEVIIAPGYSCGECDRCVAGEDNLCSAFGILGESADGTCRERMAVPVRNLLRKPGNLSHHEAATIALDFQTSWHMLMGRAALRFGESVLVQAGGSGVGSAAIQIAKLLGCRVITTVGSERKAAKARAIGADEVILYNSDDVGRRVRELTNKRGVDVVVEHVGADTWDGSVRSLARGGRLVTCGATTGADVSINLRLLFFRNLSVLGSTMGSLSELRTVLDLFERGMLRPSLDRVLPISEIAKGHELLESRSVFGKIALDLAEGSW